MAVSAPFWLLLLPLLAGGAIWLWGLQPPGATGTSPASQGGRWRTRWGWARRPRPEAAFSTTGRHRLALAIRLVLLTLLVGTLAGVSWRQDASREAVVFVVDLSASDAAVQGRAEAWITAALRSQRPDDLAGIVAVGHSALVEQPISRGPLSFDHFQSVVDPDYTNLAAGLDLAGAMLPSDARRRVVLLTDGQQNLGDATQEARLLRAEGIRLDVVPLAVRTGPEMLVDTVGVPASLHTGESFSVDVRTQSTAGGSARLDLYVDDHLAGSQGVTLAPGANSFSFPVTAPPAGFHTYRAVLVPGDGADTLAANNEASAFANVQGPPRLLVVENAAGAARNVAGALRAQGVAIDEMLATRVVPDLAVLQRYAGVVIVDTPADLLGPDFLALLPGYVRDLGHGVAVIGGPNSYAMGGYGQTPLEEILPVRMDIPQRKDTPTAAVVLIVEDLESDYGVNISKVAAKGVIKLLTPRDLVAVSDANPGWAIPLQHVTDKTGLNAAIDAMQPSDPPSYIPSLALADATLRKVQAPIKHIILLGDGDAYDNYSPLLKQIAADGISVSTVATGASGWQDFSTMQSIARWGHGHYYRADSVEAIPQIFLKEAKRVARTGIVEEHFIPSAVSYSPLLRAITTLPQLDGYVATTPKPAGENVLISSRADPILATWQYGLGRTVAWTSDSAGLWSSHLLAWPGAGRLWGNIASWILPPATNKNLTLTSTTQGGTGHLAVDVTGPLSTPRITAHIVGPTLQSAAITLLPTAPGHYEGDFDAAHQGAYLVHVQAGTTATRTLAVDGGLIVPYSPEFRLTGVDRATVDALAADNGGAVLPATEAAAWRAFADDLPPAGALRSLSGLLLLLAALLLPLDIAIRRLTLSWRELLALPFKGRDQHVTAAPASTATPLLHLRAQRGRRSATASAAQGQTMAATSRIHGEGQPMQPDAPSSAPHRAMGNPPVTVDQKDAASPSFSSQLLDAKRRRRG